MGERQVVKQLSKKRIKSQQLLNRLHQAATLVACLPLSKFASRLLVLATKKLVKVVLSKNIAKKNLLRDIYLQLASITESKSSK
jgi:hypothetical protein